MVYGGAHLFRADVARRLGQRALEALERYAPDAQALGAALGVPFSPDLYERLRVRLISEPVEDYRIDFEDGYGPRPDEEEDAHARQAARELARARDQGLLPAFTGLRLKPLDRQQGRRALRTLDLFLAELGTPPPGFVVTLPKVRQAGQAAALAEILEAQEQARGLAPGSLGIELMAETPQALLDEQGRLPIRAWVQACRGRCRGVHFGNYDFTAACGVPAGQQAVDHPLCRQALSLLIVALAGSGVGLADGPTVVLPVPLHRGPQLTPEQEEANRDQVHAAWRQHFTNILGALRLGCRQGWDLHPAQLVSRYAALYWFVHQELPEAGRRLRHFLEEAARPTRLGASFDDAATGQGLLNTFRLAVGCGALSEEEARQASGLSPDEWRARSFADILRGRRQGNPEPGRSPAPGGEG